MAEKHHLFVNEKIEQAGYEQAKDKSREYTGDVCYYVNGPGFLHLPVSKIFYDSVKVGGTYNLIAVEVKVEQKQLSEGEFLPPDTPVPKVARLKKI